MKATPKSRNVPGAKPYHISAENFRQELASRAAENAAMPEAARVGLVEEWFRTTYQEDDASVSSEAISR